MLCSTRISRLLFVTLLTGTLPPGGQTHSIGLGKVQAIHLSVLQGRWTKSHELDWDHSNEVFVLV